MLTKADVHADHKYFRGMAIAGGGMHPQWCIRAWSTTLIYIRGAFKKFCNLTIKNEQTGTVILYFFNIVSCDINAFLPLFC